MNKPKILLTRPWPAAAERALHEHFDVVIRKDNSELTVAEWHKALHTFDAICPCVADKVDAAVLDVKEPTTRILANYGVGYNHIDIAAANAHGLIVTNTPGVLTDATADLAMTLMMILARRAGEGERQVRKGEWQGWYPTHMMGSMITGARLGIIGMGRIGIAMARKAHFGFDMEIHYHNRRPVEEKELEGLDAIFYPDMENMLGEVDYLALHCPGGAQTHHLINERRLGLMRKDAFLINTARGDVVDQEALVSALENGHIAGAGLDVYEGEPAVPEALLAMDNVVLLPHLGSATIATREAMGMRVVNNLLAYFNEKEIPDQVN